MILKGISVNQNPPTKDYLWITPKGNARFWDQSNWRLIGGSGGGGTNIPEPTAAGKYLITAGSSGDYYATWGDLNLNSYINGDVGYAAVFNGSNSITSAKLTNSKIRIGDGIIEWDSTNKGFKIYNATSTQETPTTAGIYADWVSALGANSSGGGGGGDINWANLTTWDEDPEHIINENYLPYNAGTGLSLNGTTFNHSNSISQGNFGLSNNTTANSVTLPYVSYDGQGHISAVSSNTFTIGNLDASTVFNSSTKIPFINLPDLYIGYTKISNSTNSNAQLKGISKITHATTDNDTSTAAIEWDSTNNAWHFYGGIYSDSFVSALGAGSGSGGGGGINVVDLWNELTNATGSDPSYQNTQIAVAHIPTLSITDKTSGTLPVNRGGTGATSLSGVLVGNGTNAITGKTIMNNTSVGALGWTSASGNGLYIPTLNTLAYWNGAYSGTTSNINYLGTIKQRLILYNESPTGSNYGSGLRFYNKDTTTGQQQDTSYIFAYNTHSAGDYGMNMVIQSAGNIFIGGGESPSSLYSTLTTSTNENLYCTADGTIYLESNADTIANRLGIAINTNGAIVPVKAEAANNNAQNIGASNNKWANVYAVNFDGDLSGNADTATTASKLGTSTVGGPIRPFYLNAGVATACSLYRYHYDGTSDWESYAWHKVAYCTASAYADYSIRFLVSNGNSVSSGILSCRGRWDANATFSSANTYLAWTVMSNGFNKSNFVLVWKSPNLELWCKIPAQWAGYQFAVLDSGYRADNGALTWTLCDSINGHGVDSYTSGGTVITSGIDTIYTGNIVGGVNNHYMPNYNDAGVYYHGTGISWHNSSNVYVRNLLAFNSDGDSVFYGNIKPNLKDTYDVGNESYNYSYGCFNVLYPGTNNNTWIRSNAAYGSSYGIVFGYGGKTASTTLGKWTYTGLGIGTDSPSYKLEVSGDAFIGNTSATSHTLSLQSSASQLRMYAYSDGNCYIEAGNSAFNGNSTSGILYLTGYSGGGLNNIELKATTTHCSNNFYATGAVTALQTSSSDKRLKKNIKPFNATEIVNKLKPVEFEWNKKANKYNSNLELNKKNYGLIAQDSDGIIDNLVFDLPDGKGYKGVRYEKLIPILLQAVKEQQKEIDELKQIIKKLKV